LRARVEDAEHQFYAHRLRLDEAHEARMAEVEEAMKHRHDIEAAMLAINNVSTDPTPEFEMPAPEVMAEMSPREWDAFVKSYRKRGGR
jgi:hypothetical protein